METITMRFIPVDKMAKLREAARNGDVKAKKILQAQLSDSDFSADLDAYFAPAPVPEEKPALPQRTKLEQFLADNNVKEGDPEYESFVEDFRRENPDTEQDQECVEEKACVFDKLIKDEIDAIKAYDEAILQIMESDEYSDNEKKGIITKLNEIKNDEAEHFDELRRLKKDTIEKEEKAAE